MRKNVFLAVVAVTFATAGFGASRSAEIAKAAQDILPKVIEWRRHIHQHPELGNREVKTAEYIANHLKKLGIEVKTGVAKTGVVGVLKGKNPGPVIGLRADMDALPLTERAKVSFASKERATYNGQDVGVMHACGHDSHVAMLMGTATVLAHMKDKLNGSVVFIFQPAEEGAPLGEEGGARVMVQEGVMDAPKIDAIFGIHIFSYLEIGKIAYRAGAMMASADEFTIRVKGKPTHGAYPWAGVDPVVVSSQIVLGLQTIVSRQTELTKSPAVITVAKINGGIRNNIIPEEVIMSGTIRTLDSDMRKDIQSKIKMTAQKIAESAGAIAEVSIDPGYPVTFNSPELVKKTLPSLINAVGQENLTEAEWTTGAEDFSYYGSKAPAFFFGVGGMPKGKNSKEAPPHHSPDFYIDDSQLDVGVKAFCNIVFDFS